MATYNTDGKYALRALQGSSSVNEIDEGIAALRDDVRDNMAGFATGLASARPAASVAAGLIYQATDTGRVWISTGSTWIPISGPYDRHTDAPTTEPSLTSTLQTVMSVTFTPPFGGMEYMVWINCGVIISAAANSKQGAVFEFHLDGVKVGVVDDNARTVSYTAHPTAGTSEDQQPSWHFPLAVPGGSHTLRVQAKMLNPIVSGSVILRRERRLTAIGMALA